MLHRLIIALATIAALAITPGSAFAAGHGSVGGHPGGHFAAGGGGPHGIGGGHFAVRGGHLAGGGPHFGRRFIGGRGFHRGYAPGYYYGGYAPDYGYDYPPDYGDYYEPDYGAAAALGIISIISGVMASHAYHHHHCWLHHGRRVCR